jgi:four helix bundle protein
MVRHGRCSDRPIMGVRSFTELDAWKLANELKLGVYDLIQSDQVKRDLEFRNQIRNAAASAPRNIAEGFGRYQPREFSQYLRIANGSLMETSNHLMDGKDRSYFKSEDVDRLQVLARRASAAVTALIRYLKNAKAPNPNPRTPREPRTKEPTNQNHEPKNPRTSEP